MSRPGSSRTVPTGRPLRFVGGDAALDLVNTADWTPKGLVHERLFDYRQLLAWALGAGVVSLEELSRLRSRAEAQPAAAAHLLDRARALRRTLQQLFRSIADSDPSSEGWEAFNDELAATLARLRISATESTPSRGGARRRSQGAVASWSWVGQGEALDSVLWPVVWSAARLATSDEASRIRVCAGSDCGWMYVDRSRNRLRRWCEMKTCGTAAKSRRRRDRHRREAHRAGGAASAD
jgi:predicted RNA-binding Zn ribbon-like protein